MDANVEWIVPLVRATTLETGLVGGKGAKLAQLHRAGFRVPAGFLVTTAAYDLFVRRSGLETTIGFELNRKPFASMRWEEIWDVALRIRSAFLSADIPDDLAEPIARAVNVMGSSKSLVVRSSAPGEDAVGKSFAGLHESVVGVVGEQAVLDAIKVVWASLWSDAALLYRRELELDPSTSRMAVVIQELIDEDRSGVAFGRDPREPSSSHSVVEAIPGPCSDLVDGLVDPDRWVLDRGSGDVVSWRPGDRGAEAEGGSILDESDLCRIHEMLVQVESLFGWAPDTEWTGRDKRFTLLQARPITTGVSAGSDERDWYLTLRPSMRRLGALAERVSEGLIPELEALGQRLASEQIDAYDDQQLATALEERYHALQKWRQVYLDDFIPFAHGVRQLGVYYNDAVRPLDPYEFVGLLKGQDLAAFRRNRIMLEMVEILRANAALHQIIAHKADEGWQAAMSSAKPVPGGERFWKLFEEILAEHLDVAYEGERLRSHPDHLLQTIRELASSVGFTGDVRARGSAPEVSADDLESRLLEAVGPERKLEAEEVVAIARLSWRLRDDDNLLIGRLESQVLRVLDTAFDRLRAAGRLDDGSRPTLESASLVAEALRRPSSQRLRIPHALKPIKKDPTAAEGAPRQLVGQPASPGLATGRVCRVLNAQDLGSFRAGQVLVCDAIQPTMTHLVPLARAIVERRGGMLIHGAIIAREMGIPCVNGIADAVQLLRQGVVVTVDGYLGIVTVGEPEFDLEEMLRDGVVYSTGSNKPSA